jgi:hypothetical protein
MQATQKLCAIQQKEKEKSEKCKKGQNVKGIQHEEGIPSLLHSPHEDSVVGSTKTWWQRGHRKNACNRSNDSRIPCVALTSFKGHEDNVSLHGGVEELSSCVMVLLICVSLNTIVCVDDATEGAGRRPDVVQDRKNFLVDILREI